MDDEKLIELVEQHEIIYNRHHPSYKDHEKKNEAFEIIATELGIPYIQFVVNRYRTLRDRFVRYKRLRGTEEGVKYYLPVMDKMEFLSPYVFNRKNRSKHVRRPEFNSEDSNSMDTMQFSSSVRNEDTEYSIKISPVVKSNTPRTLPQYKRRANTQPEGIPYKKFALDPNDEIDREFREALTSFQTLCKAKEQAQTNEALEGFRKMIVSTIAQMSSAKQTRAMLAVTEAVMHIKMEGDN
ncbi:uncharacterized protein LOC142226684 [Haematobia irritans]|uniref:uncharacterized protein LOC142226684 n=1 Tax=Haematobia irritans TaxID=7368 RepID=UPI003F4F5EE8